MFWFRALEPGAFNTAFAVHHPGENRCGSVYEETPGFRLGPRVHHPALAHSLDDCFMHRPLSQSQHAMYRRQLQPGQSQSQVRSPAWYRSEL